MKSLPLLMLLFAGIFTGLYAQSYDGDAEVARQYAQWARQAMDEDRWSEALTALERAADFANVSSDISYLLAAVRLHEGKSRTSVVEALDRAIEINRWGSNSETQALLLKAEQLIVMRNYSGALVIIEQIGENSDSAMLRLFALKGLALNSGNVQTLARFRSQLLAAMDRYPRDARPLRIFFEYARNTEPELSDLPSSDLNLLELALRRLPFLLEIDPELAWMAAPFMRNVEDARRLVASYRAAQVKPLPASIPVALNLGLIGDIDAVEELFGADNENSILYRETIIDVYNLLRSEEGRIFFTRKLLSFSGVLFSDDDRDGIVESAAFYSSGAIEEFAYDRNQANVFDLRVLFDTGGVPVTSVYPLTGGTAAYVKWERYPSVEQVTLADEVFLFRPADFHFAPVSFILLGGSVNAAGLLYPQPEYQFLTLTRRSLVSFCASISRPSVEFNGAVERIFLENGIPLQAEETLNGRQVSVTEFERGIPVIQRVDLDLDGRMETVRRFRRPESDFSETFDYRSLIVSSESDWGDGRFMTGEMYLQDGSVVYSWDVDGSGVFNYSETETGREQ
jgi:tetratricopeptide (TPR) repeat protein